MSVLIEIKPSKVLGTASVDGMVREGLSGRDGHLSWDLVTQKGNQQVKIWGRMSRQKEEQLWRPWGGSGLERNSMARAYEVIDMVQGDIWGRQARS